MLVFPPYLLALLKRRFNFLKWRFVTLKRRFRKMKWHWGKMKSKTTAF
jgi:hypothetical protein